MKNELVALVLAGGEGKRFWPLSTNKVLWPYFGKPLLQHSVIDVLPNEVSRIVIVASQSNKSVIQSLKFPVPHKTVIQENPKGMADAILNVESNITGSSLLVINGDDVNDIGMYEGVMSKSAVANTFGVIPGWRSERYKDLGYLVLEGERIVRIIEKPGEGNEPSKYVFMVGYYIQDSDVLLNQLKKISGDRDDVHELALSALMNEKQIILYEHTGGFASLKYPWHVLDVMDELFKRLRPYKGENVEIKQSVILEGDVYIANNVRIFENTKIVGPCYIGDNTIIGNNNIIRNSHIGSNVVTGFSTDITRSYIGDNCWFHSNYIGDSVLSENVSIGSGTVLANFRLDEGNIWSAIKEERLNTKRNKLGAIIGKNVRIGVNTSIMPGVKVGKGSFIGAGVVLDKDIPDESFCMLTPGYTVTKNQKGIVRKNRGVYKKLIR